MNNKKQKLELTWIGKDQELKLEPRILIEDSTKSYGDKNSGNILIHGDNLLALKALETDFSSKIKCIYIDPPYNTGSAFEHYDDNLEHSTWLSLLSPRIKLLYKLLSDDGFFCCHIDDSESHYLKVLLDEVFGRDNYLTTLYIQVRYPNKTLAEDSDYQKVIEQCFVYSKNKFLAKLNRPKIEYSLDKFIWDIEELESGEELMLGNKKVIKLKPNQYKITKKQPNISLLKETWATGSLSRVRASAGEFFELYLSERKDTDGLGCLYKIYGIGEDGLGYRYISGPKKASANKGKFYSGVPLSRVEDIKSGTSYKYLPVTNFYDMAGAFGNCRLEGGVDFKGGKKPEVLIQTILNYFSNEGDFVLDSFLGSGTTIAVAQKMNRRWVGIELGNQADTHCLSRLKAVIDGSDNSGVTKIVNWQGGGGFKFYELAPSLLRKDGFGNLVIDEQYNANMLAAAMCKHEGFKYLPDEAIYWKQGKSTETDFIFVTTGFVTIEQLDSIHAQMSENESLLICAKSFAMGCESHYSNITIKKIPQMILGKCEFGKDNYDLNIVKATVEEAEESSEAQDEQ